MGVDVVHKKTTNNTSAELKKWKMYKKLACDITCDITCDTTGQRCCYIYMGYFSMSNLIMFSLLIIQRKIRNKISMSQCNREGGGGVEKGM